jgi:hypothetical protein
MIAKSLKNLLLYIAQEEHAAMYTRVVELFPDFEKLMLWQLERHRMDSGQVRLSRPRPTTFAGSFEGVRSTRQRKKARTFAEESGDIYMKEEAEREKLREINRKKKLEKQKLLEEEEKRKKKEEKEMKKRIRQQKKMAEKKVKALRKSARKAATWSGPSDDEPFVSDDEENDNGGESILEAILVSKKLKTEKNANEKDNTDENMEV